MVLPIVRHDPGEIVNRLGIIEVLRRAWKPLDGRELTISVHAGDRNRESRGMRFIVNQGNEPLCCVKRLPLAGPFDPRAILAMQKAFGSLSAVRVPDVLGWIQDDQNWFVVEQFVPNGMRLDDAVRLNVVSRNDAEKLVARVLQEVYAGASGNPDPKVDEERILAAIESSRLSDRAKTCFRGHIFNELSDDVARSGLDLAAIFCRGISFSAMASRFWWILTSRAKRACSRSTFCGSSFIPVGRFRFGQAAVHRATIFASNCCF